MSQLAFTNISTYPESGWESIQTLFLLQFLEERFNSHGVYKIMQTFIFECWTIVFLLILFLELKKIWQLPAAQN